MSKRVTIILDDSTLAELQRRGAKTGATLTGQIKAALRVWIAEQVKEEEF